MNLFVTRDDDFVVLRIKAGREVNGFAGFLYAAADAIETGKIPPTNPRPTTTPVKMADTVRDLAKRVHDANI